MSNRGRSTTGEASVPYYLGAPIQEAAKYLRLTAPPFNMITNPPNEG
jgi:hypothetical protein